jgi:hypothetical protein
MKHQWVNKRSTGDGMTYKVNKAMLVKNIRKEYQKKDIIFRGTKIAYEPFLGEG